MSDISVRPARVDELPAIGALTIAAYRADGYLPESGDPTGYAATLSDADSRMRSAELLVAVDTTGTLLGTVTIALPGTPYAEISREGELEFRMLAVSTRARNRGVGETLVRAVFTRARELALPTIVLCSSRTMSTAHRLYERLGFRRLPDRDWRPGPEVELLAYAAPVPTS
ncbi:GNAT family N-acetyltransferase [Actinokineospora bangkokensis]|uniref:GNAT family N-acetyltransferase n=1 Tax=Actinokineospora bangkokensis TaxID=1193682 RepID=A0A1Q9LHY1_9PSEU|nr:GNAT family N-acetyltransferase [Actinokineospora bangkokensis]OLR91624.1 GNAT family N-acetyltransferase [Actinokineospora bangkokensis]